MKVKVTRSYTFDIYVTGSRSAVEDYLQEYCMKNGFCFSIIPLEYIYSGGKESGYSVRIINYARFPKGEEQLEEIANHVAKKLIEKTNTWSASVVTPTHSYYITQRDEG